MSKAIKNIATENPSYFLCSRRDIPGLIERAKAEAAKLLEEFSAFYTTSGKLTIHIEPIEYACGFSIGGKLKWDDQVIIEESDCGLLFLQLNEVMLNRMIRLGFPSGGIKEAAT